MNTLPTHVLVIHGGDAFATYEEYLSDLKEWPVSLGDGNSIGWKRSLGADLGENFLTTLPKMPNPSNAKYEEWKIWFEKYLALLPDNSILVGHSLGGVFLAKYLAENVVTKKIAGTFIVAAPFDIDSDRALIEFTLPPSLELLSSQAGALFLYQSTDDPVVPVSEIHKYQAMLPNATVRILEGQGHILSDHFTELVDDIQSLS